MLQSDNDNLRLLAALACGITKDAKASSELAKLLSDKSPSIVRSACLALVAIGDKQALEIVANTLVNGTEVSRRAAAEALANNPLSGHPTLKDGSTHEDLRVRHSIVYGLMRIPQPEARKILARMQLEEKEWIVRNAAIQAMEELTQPAAGVPNPLPDLAETPWLIDYAAKQGMGVAPGRPAHELVIEALKKGNTTERLLALDYLSMHADESAIPVIYSWYFGSSGEIRNAAYQTLWALANSGISLPPPKQFGFDQ
jgi:HEAT repeat protein